MLEDINLFLSLKKSGIGYIHYQQYGSLFVNNNEMEQCEKVYYEIEEIAENGELFKYVYELNKGFTEQICAKIFLNIVKSVNLLHKKEHDINIKNNGKNIIKLFRKMFLIVIIEFLMKSCNGPLMILQK